MVKLDVRVIPDNDMKTIKVFLMNNSMTPFMTLEHKLAHEMLRKNKTNMCKELLNKWCIDNNVNYRINYIEIV